MNRYFTIAFFIIPLTWAGSFIAGKYVVAEIDVFSSVFWRFGLSALIMLPGLILFKRNTHPPFMDKSFATHLGLVTLTSGILYHVLFFLALNYASPTNTALIIALNPFFTAIAERFFFRYNRTNRFYVGFIIAFAGAIWVNLSRGSGLSWPGIGELLCLLASLTWSGYTIIAKKTKHPEWDALWINGYIYLLTAILIFPFIPSIFEFSLTWRGWSGLWYMAIFPTTIGYTLFYIGVQKKGPAWASTFIYLVPSFTANLDHIFFNAVFTIPMVVGTTLVVIGLLFGNITKNQLQTVYKWLPGSK
jgi:drug/metabolite transporter (DMT)-like permease